MKHTIDYYREHAGVNLKIALKHQILALLFVANAIYPCKYTKFRYWELQWNKRIH